MILPDINFVDTNAEATLDRIVQGYEAAAGRKLGEADPIMLFLKTIACCDTSFSKCASTIG